MSNEEINDREYSRIKESLENIASEEVLDLVEQLELVIEGKCIAREIEELKREYRAMKEGA
jgi:hypothetical protein